jgi:DivIVA domain-containing protein
MDLNAADVRHIRFHKSGFGRRGYREREVDDFLANVAKTLDGAGTLTAEDVRRVAFSTTLGRNGYEEVEVDDFLDTILVELQHRQEHLPDGD